MKKYTDIKIGDVERIQHTITLEDIKKFVDLTGDDNKLHVDEVFAKKTQFRKPVVHGMLGASFISTVIGTKMPGDGALWFSQSLEFLLPVRVGDNLSITAEVIKKHDNEKIIELSTIIENQNKQIVTKGFAKVKVLDVLEQEIVVSEQTSKEMQTALILGATGGIGKATAKQLAKDGFNIIIQFFNNSQDAYELKEYLESYDVRVHCVKANLLNPDDIKSVYEFSKRHFKTIDVIVNAAAVTINNLKFSSLEWEDFQKQFEMAVKSNFLIVKEFLPMMIENSYGRIINIGSLAVDKPNSDWSHYITAKSALIGLTKSLAFELAPKGICINLVTPSLINTDLTANVPEKVKLLTASQTPLRRLAMVEDVASAISFLVSPKANFITGQNIRINGGQFMI